MKGIDRATLAERRLGEHRKEETNMRLPHSAGDSMTFLRDIPRGLVKMGWRGWGFCVGFSVSLTLMAWGIWGFVETFR